MKKNTTFLLLALCMSWTASVLAQKNSYLTLNFGRVNFTAEDTPYYKELLFTNGASASMPLDIRGMKGLNLALGYERQLYRRFNGSLSLTGVRVNSAKEELYSTAFVSGLDLKDVYFPMRRNLWAGLGQAQLLFDFIKDEEIDLKFGIGGVVEWSRFEYDSYLSLYYKGQGETVLASFTKTTENKRNLGHFFSINFGAKLTKSLYFQAQFVHNRIENHVFNMANIGLGFMFDGTQEYR